MFKFPDNRQFVQVDRMVSWQLRNWQFPDYTNPLRGLDEAMRLSDLFRRVFGWASTTPVPTANRGDALSGSRGSDLKQPSAEDIQLDAWLAASDAGLLAPPADVHSPAAWDEYWRNHLKVGPFEQGLADRMSSDETLPVLLAERRARTVLCAGNGLSLEAISLALLGFNVTALDISAVPGEVFGGMLRDVEHPLRRIPGFSLRDDGSVVFGATGAIDSALCPMHQSAAFPPRCGGSLSFMTGDLMIPEVCRGPFDVVVERRTLQLFSEADRLLAFERLVARLSDRGVFASQQHAGCWRPGDDRTHYAESWLASRGFVIGSGTNSGEFGVGERLARLVFSSG
jgi:hypothetical protein